MSTENAFAALQTLMIFSIGFPHPSMTNRPEFFGLEATNENIKKFMSLGKMKLFPEEVQKEIFGSMAESPIHEWELIRSQFQGFVANYTFLIFEKIRSLPVAKLPACTELERVLTLRGMEAKNKYISHYDELKEASVKFWREHSHLYHIDADDMEQAIRNAFPTKAQIEDRFKFRVTYFELKSPETIGALSEVDALERQAVIEACDQVAKEAGHKIQEEVDSFIKDVASDLEQKTKSALSSLIESIKSGKWNQKSINSVLKFAQEFEQINFIGYSDLQVFMDDMKVKLETYKASDVKEDADMQTQLNELLETSVCQLNEMAERDKAEVLAGFGNLGKKRKVRPF